MDTLAVIRDKAARLEKLLPKSGISSVVRHIEMAERHFDVARKESESDLFVDVIYRTNHAFEGILREAYAILAGKDSTGKSASYIENYLKDIFKDRVMELFANYRSKWRNPSTHDHVETFSESEAFLAILSVTSFSGILMDQMISHLAFKDQQQLLKSRIDEVHKVVSKHSDEALIDLLTYIFPKFASWSDIPSIQTEVEFFAAVHAFLTMVLPNVQVEMQPRLPIGSSIVYPDLVVRQGNETIVIELKRYREWTKKNQTTAFNQVRNYVEAISATGGILLLLPSKDAIPVDEIYDKILSEPIGNDKTIVTIRLLPRNASKTVKDTN